jgi:diacylglycerol kinase
VPWKAAAALRYALRGVAMLFEERNIWVLAVATALVLAAGFLFRLSAIEWCMVLFAIALVWVAEALNSALERLTDLASPEFHPLAGKAKDMAAGAVLLAVAGAVLIGIVIFGPRLF